MTLEKIVKILNTRFSISSATRLSLTILCHKDGYFTLHSNKGKRIIPKKSNSDEVFEIIKEAI